MPDVRTLLNTVKEVSPLHEDVLTPRESSPDVNFPTYFAKAFYTHS